MKIQINKLNTTIASVLFINIILFFIILPYQEHPNSIAFLIGKVIGAFIVTFILTWILTKITTYEYFTGVNIFCLILFFMAYGTYSGDDGSSEFILMSVKTLEAFFLSTTNQILTYLILRKKA